MNRLTLALAAVGVGALAGYVLAYRYYGTFIRGWDAQMYYAQVRSAVVDGDLDFRNELTELSNDRAAFADAKGVSRLPRSRRGRIANFYPAGWALVTAAPFAVTHAICKLAGSTADGYSTPYDLAASLWQVIIAFGGIVLLAACVKKITDIDAASLAILGGVFATNIIYYVCVYPTMSHAASLSASAALVYLAFRMDEPAAASAARRSWIWAGLVALLLVLIRPTDAVLLLILAPAAWRCWRSSERAACLVNVGFPVVGVMLAVCLQLLVWRLTYGHWLLNAYGARTFDPAATIPDELRYFGTFAWTRPALTKMLLSPDRGAWYYHPYYALGALGLAVQLSRHVSARRWLWTACAGAYAIHIYVHSCWVVGFGYSFGNRMFVNSAPLAVVGVAALHGRLPRWGQGCLAVTMAALIAWNLLLVVGFVRGTIPPHGSVPVPALVASQANTVRYIVSRLMP